MGGGPSLPQCCTVVLHWMAPAGTDRPETEPGGGTRSSTPFSGLPPVCSDLLLLALFSPSCSRCSLFVPPINTAITSRHSLSLSLSVLSSSILLFLLFLLSSLSPRPHFGRVPPEQSVPPYRAPFTPSEVSTQAQRLPAPSLFGFLS